ncbi:MAG: P-aminobenzoate N-oxygenase AurF [Deltaproteobacteria bacterium]|nr:MAG: P-aminobenzoate N-oxygenase AurF [Deltaproteobacteria bacterium]
MTAFSQTSPLREDKRTYKRLQINHRRNKEQDHTELLDAASARFDYAACRDVPWNPEPFSLLWGTPFWDQASAAERVKLNQLYWVAYYADIISAEIATIYFNQTSAAALFGLEDFRLVCDTLDLESSQERAHINAFKTVGEAVEAELFGERVFTYEMRGPFAETVIFTDTNRVREKAKRMLLRTFGVLSAQNAFIGCQYFLIRGLRTLLGKIVQHQLSGFHQELVRDGAPDDLDAISPIPSQISYFHFQDESYHFNSSTIISHDVLKSLPTPSRFERWVMNETVKGAQKDLRPFTVVGDGLNWHGPRTYEVVHKVLTSKVFGLSSAEALAFMRKTYCEENEGLHRAHQTHVTAIDSYRKYLDDVDYLTAHNRDMTLAADIDIPRVLAANQKAFAAFEARA